MMPDEAEKMAALKRAYGDTILNTAKESAARILASEQRALQLQRDLSLVKAESLALLLRLKAIMDAKINESEKANLSQARKIQELEVQISEAKGTVDCLRSEVRRLNSELDHTRDFEADHCDIKSTGDNANFEKYDAHGNKEKSDSSLHSSTGRKSIHNVDCCSIKDGNHDLTSIILSNKEPELYRNGCTQRIRAFERNHASDKNLFTHITDQESDIKVETAMCANEKSGRPWTTHVDMAEKVARKHKKKPQKGHLYSRMYVNHHEKKKQYGLMDIDHPKAGQSDVDESADNTDRNRSIMLPDILKPCSSQVSGGDQETRKRQRTILKGSCTNKSSGLVDGNRTMTRSSALMQSSNIGKSYSYSCITCQENVSENGPGKPQVATRNEVVDDPFSDEDGEDDTQMERKMLKKRDHKLAEDLISSITKEEFESKSVIKDDYKNEPGKLCPLDAEARSDKTLKYTFQRKRKRGSVVSKDGSASIEETDMCNRRMDKDDDKNMSNRIVDNGNEVKLYKEKKNEDSALTETQKSSIVVESSRDSRRMAQVARQLISLSAQSWW